MKYFTTEICTVKQYGIEVKNALVVTGIQDGPSQPDLTFLIPEAYRGANIMGKRYVHDTQSFEEIDPEPVVHETTQSDRIEDAALQAALNSEYLVALNELGL